MPYCYEYPRPSVATDVIVCTKNKPFRVLLIQRKNPPFQHMWALPGGFMDINERLYDTAKRELMEETGIKINELKFFGVYDDPDRDPRGRTIGIVYYALVSHLLEPEANDDASCAKWFLVDQLPQLAFDHKTIIEEFKEKILTSI